MISRKQKMPLKLQFLATILNVIDVQDTIFARVGSVIAELWPFDFAKMWSGIDFRS